MFPLRSSSSALRSVRSAACATRHTPRLTLRPLVLQSQLSNFSVSAIAMGKDTLTEAIKDDHEEVRVNTPCPLSTLSNQRNCIL